jgi:glycosyltransferase involved in cell wall biosynthesis
VEVDVSITNDPAIQASVIIPTKNRSGLLMDALDAISNQTFTGSFELFVMDNLSTDDTEEVVRNFAESVPFPVHYVRMERDGGPVPARNCAARMAAGRVLAFTDSDCRPCPEWLERGFQAIESGAALASGPVTYKPEQLRGFFAKRTAETLTEHPTYPTANAFYRKDVFLELGGFDEGLSFTDPFDRAVECADTDLAWRVIEAGYRNEFVPDQWVYHEIEVQSPSAWLLEPTRLFVLPELIRRHPQLRDRLLTHRLFFHPGSIIYYIAALLAIPMAIVSPWLLIVFPIAFAVRAIRRLDGFAPRAWGQAGMQVAMNIARNYLLCATLVYGSVRFRTLVL